MAEGMWSQRRMGVTLPRREREDDRAFEIHRICPEMAMLLAGQGSATDLVW